MTHENLMVTINLTKVRELQEKAPDKFFKTDKGDTLLTLFADVRRTEGDKGQTHSVHAGKVDGFTFYIGQAKPSKFQPDSNSQQPQPTKSSTPSGTPDMPW